MDHIAQPTNYNYHSVWCVVGGWVAVAERVKELKEKKDRKEKKLREKETKRQQRKQNQRDMYKWLDEWTPVGPATVSYTHLTLPTILRV